MTDDNHKPYTHLEHRVGTVEQELAGLKTDIAYIRDQLSGLASSLSNMTGNMRTNWGTMAAWAAVLVGFMIFYQNLASKPYEMHLAESAIKFHALSEDISENRTMHLDAHGKVAAIKENLNEVDKTIAVHNEMLHDKAKNISALRQKVDDIGIMLSNHNTRNLRDLEQLNYELDYIRKQIDATQSNRWTNSDHKDFETKLQRKLEVIESRINESCPKN